MTTDPTSTADNPGPQLPAPFDLADVEAQIALGRRRITLTLSTAGVLHRCRYQRAWFELTEPQPWSGEPSLWATRQPPGEYLSGRYPFTDAATQRIVDHLMPPVARYGWARWWDELHRLGEPYCDPQVQADHAISVAHWWRRLGELRAAYAAGDVALDPLSDLGVGRQRRVDLWGNTTWEPVIAAAVMNGRTVGWLTDAGDLLPMGHLLDEPLLPAGDQ